MNSTFSSEYERFQDDLRMNPSKNSSFSLDCDDFESIGNEWEIKTLRSRNILAANCQKVVANRKKTRVSRKKNSVLRKIVKFLTCSTALGEMEIHPETEDQDDSRLLKQKLNDLMLVSLSYEAELANLQEEIERLRDEKKHLLAKSKNADAKRVVKLTKLKKSKSVFYSTQSSSGCSSMKSEGKTIILKETTDIHLNNDVLFVC